MRVASKVAGVLLTGALLAVPAAMFAQGPPPPPPGGYPGNGYQQGPGEYQQGGPGSWDAAPGEYNRDLQRNAFRAGLYGASQDFRNHRPPNVRNRDEFRNYNGPERRVYKQAFARGYSAWWSHQGPAGPGRPY